MPNAPVAAAATGLPAFDPNDFDLSLSNAGRLLAIAIERLGEINRHDLSNEHKTYLGDADALCWVVSEKLERLSAIFIAKHFPGSAARGEL